MKPKKITLYANERILAVEPEFCRGPGWANAATWVHIADSVTNKVRTECIQPDERTPEMRTLFSIGAMIYDKLIAAVPTKIANRQEAKP